MASRDRDHPLGAWASITRPGTNIDRRICNRVVPMEVLSLGFSRTGTLSLQEALTVLGYPNPYHYSKMFENVRDAEIWTEALQAKYVHQVDWDWKQHFDQLLGYCGAVTDTPSVCFWEELMQAYPEAKIVLVERDEEKWFESCALVIDGTLNPVGRYVFYYTDPFWYGAILQTGLLWVKGFFGTLNANEAKKNARAAYRKHNANIKAAAPKGQLLEYQLGSGWGPLCEFLGKPVPDVAFPHRNEAYTLNLALSAFLGRAMKNTLVNLGILVGLGAVVAGVSGAINVGIQ